MSSLLEVSVQGSVDGVAYVYGHVYVTLHAVYGVLRT